MQDLNSKNFDSKEWKSHNNKHIRSPHGSKDFKKTKS